MSASMSVGFACRWDRKPEETWSGTPWRLREAMRDRSDAIVDLALGPPVAARAALKAIGMRRAGGEWRSLWKHSKISTHWVERDLGRQSIGSGVDAVLEIQDLGVVHQPYLVIQDLSYGLLLQRFGADGVPHFRTLGAARIRELHERQIVLYQRAAALLPMSDWLARDMIRSGVPANRVHVVNPGVNVPVAPDAPLRNRRLGPVRRLLLVGRDFDTKAGAQVVAAFRQLRRDLGESVELTVIGPPAWPLRGAIPEGVTFLGPRSRAQVAAALDEHDLFVMPSRFEGFGIAFAEALVRGLPCIGRDTCAMPEIIDEATGGRLVRSEDPQELADLIVTTLSDDALYAACAAAAPARRAHYSWTRAADQVLDATADVVG